MSSSGADMAALSSAGASPQAQGVFGGSKSGLDFMGGQANQMVPFYGGGQNYDMPQQDYLKSDGQQMNLAGLLGGAGGGKTTAGTPQLTHGGAMGGRGGSMSFLPESAITSPYTLSTGAAQGLLQQIANQYKLNPLG